MNADYVRQIINLTQTTSGSYLLLSSLDISRRNLALHGEEIFDKVTRLARYAREEINDLGDYYAFSRELVNGDSVFDFDETKLSVNTLDIGLAGIEVYDLLRDEYDIQVEFGDLGNILAYLSVGDKTKHIERLISALSDIRRLHKRERKGLWESEYISPEVVYSPQNAFYAAKESVPLAQLRGRRIRRVRDELSARHPDPRAGRANHARRSSSISATPRKRAARSPARKRWISHG